MNVKKSLTVLFGLPHYYFDSQTTEVKKNTIFEEASSTNQITLIPQ